MMAFAAPTAHALISNGADAVDVLGQFEGLITTPAPSYTRNTADVGTTNISLRGPNGILVDTTYHRLFIVDSTNNRVLVHELDDNDELVDYLPDYVLGQQDFGGSTFGSTQSGLSVPAGLAFDPATNRLFVSETNGHRVKIFDVAEITNGEDAIGVIGQSTFTGGSSANTQVGLNSPMGLAFDEATNRLFVSEGTTHRVKVFDVSTSTLATSTPAVRVIGQSTFTGTSVGNTQAGLNTPRELAFDPATNRLFVAETNGNRVKVFDVSTSTLATSTPAVRVIGQSTFTGTSVGNTQAGLNTPRELAFDPATNRLFVAETNGNRVKVFDVSTSTLATSTPAVRVIGQSTFTGATSGNTQTGLNSPNGLALDLVSNTLYVAELNGNKIKTFDVSTSTLATSTPAINLLGQTAYASTTATSTQWGLDGPRSLALNPTTGELFVGENNGNRVKVFDVASISDGENATNLLGQYTSMTGTTPLYTSSGLNMSPNELGLDSPEDAVIDGNNHRLFIADYSNNRIIVHQLDEDNELIDYVADYVLGQSDFRSSSSGNSASKMNGPIGLAFDPNADRLFVSEENTARVKVFDVAEITNGEDAINVLGQVDFTGSSFDTSTSTFNGPYGMDYDADRDFLFVADRYNERVLVFDVVDITNGEEAINVIGQEVFNDYDGCPTNETRLCSPRDVEFDSVSNRLFVADSGEDRVLVFDVAEITNGEAAVNVIGKTSFADYSYVNTDENIDDPWGIAFDETSQRLFVAEGYNSRVKVFDVATSTITDGMTPSNVLGQSTFTGFSAANTRSGLNYSYGIDFDPVTGYLYVSEQSGNRVKIFDASTTTPEVIEEEEEVVAETPAPAPRPSGSSSARRAANLAAMTNLPARIASTPAVAQADGTQGQFSSAEITSFISRLMSLLGTPSGATVSIPEAAISFSGRDLTLESEGAEVKSLQEFLIGKASGASSQALAQVGATGYFGAITQRALAEYQASVGISPAQGYFGPVTRAHMKAIGY